MKCNINALKLKEIINTEGEKQLWTNEVKRQKIEELKAVFGYIKDEEVVTFKKARRKAILENVGPIPEKSDGVGMSEYHDRLQLVRNLMYTKEEYNDLYVNLTLGSISIFLTNSPLEAKKFFNSNYMSDEEKLHAMRTIRYRTHDIQFIDEQGNVVETMEKEDL